MDTPPSPQALAAALRGDGYLADRGLATVLFVGLSLGRTLIRLQCYEGIEVSQAMYEWDYARQMLHIRASSVAAAARMWSICRA